MSKVLEVCVDTVESAFAAMSGGASRLELCSSLADGGLTPTPGMLNQIQNINRNMRKIPIYCMVRCRAGDFIYSQDEIEIMREDAKILRKAGADGIVFGALLPNGDVDMKSCREIIKAAYPLPATFHRAFDFCRRPTIEIEVIIDLGFQRILTSGQQQTAQLGVKLIKKLMEQVENRIIIMPGGGINKANIKFIIENTGCNEFHGSFKKLKESSNNNGAEAGKSNDEEEITLGSREESLYVTDLDAVAEMVHIMKTV